MPNATRVHVSESHGNLSGDSFRGTKWKHKVRTVLLGFSDTTAANFAHEAQVMSIGLTERELIEQ